MSLVQLVPVCPTSMKAGCVTVAGLFLAGLRQQERSSAGGYVKLRCCGCDGAEQQKFLKPADNIR